MVNADGLAIVRLVDLLKQKTNTIPTVAVISEAERAKIEALLQKYGLSANVVSLYNRRNPGDVWPVFKEGKHDTKPWDTESCSLSDAPDKGQEGQEETVLALDTNMIHYEMQQPGSWKKLAEVAVGYFTVWIPKCVMTELTAWEQSRASPAHEKEIISRTLQTVLDKNIRNLTASLGPPLIRSARGDSAIREEIEVMRFSRPRSFVLAAGDMAMVVKSWASGCKAIYAPTSGNGKWKLSEGDVEGFFRAVLRTSL